MREYRVLLVDDNKIDRRLYCRLLAKLETDTCRVYQAGDGTAGLAALRAQRIRLRAA